MRAAGPSSVRAEGFEPSPPGPETAAPTPGSLDRGLGAELDSWLADGVRAGVPGVGVRVPSEGVGVATGGELVGRLLGVGDGGAADGTGVAVGDGAGVGAGVTVIEMLIFARKGEPVQSSFWRADPIQLQEPAVSPRTVTRKSTQSPWCSLPLPSTL